MPSCAGVPFGQRGGKGGDDAGTYADVSVPPALPINSTCVFHFIALFPNSSTNWHVGRRFGHEGTKRRAFFHPLLREWQDVTTLALLDMDWALRASLSKYKAAPKSLWDELFLRHERERDELLRWEEGRGRAGAMGVKRSASVETLRAVPMALEPDSESDAGESDAGPAVSRASSSVGSKGKKRMAPTNWARDPYDGASSDAESEFDEGARKRTALDLDRSGASSPALSDISLQSVPSSVTSSSASAGARSPPSTPSASGSGSDWDLMESDSSSSFGDD